MSQDMRVRLIVENDSHLCHKLPQVAILLIAIRTTTYSRNYCNLWPCHKLPIATTSYRGLPLMLWHGAGVMSAQYWRRTINPQLLRLADCHDIVLTSSHIGSSTLQLAAQAAYCSSLPRCALQFAIPRLGAAVSICVMHSTHCKSQFVRFSTFRHFSQYRTFRRYGTPRTWDPVVPPRTPPRVPQALAEFFENFAKIATCFYDLALAVCTVCIAHRGTEDCGSTEDFTCVQHRISILCVREIDTCIERVHCEPQFTLSVNIGSCGTLNARVIIGRTYDNLRLIICTSTTTS